MASQKTVGVLLFEGFELLDVFGPLEAWGIHAQAGGALHDRNDRGGGWRG